MSEQQPQNPSNNPEKPAEQVSQAVQYSQISARVPEKLNRGVFATNALVLSGNQELICDFLLRMVPPYLLAARVVLPYSALGPMVNAIAENVEKFKARFGAPSTPPPPPPNTPQPNIVEVYDQLKISEEVAVASYANTLMISHTASEYCMDFILDAFPRPVVTQRIYLSAPQVPGFLNTLKRSFEQLQQRVSQQQLPPAQTPPTQNPPPPQTPPAT
jgi:hypothetical protein